MTLSTAPLEHVEAVQVRHAHHLSPTADCCIDLHFPYGHGMSKLPSVFTSKVLDYILWHCYSMHLVMTQYGLKKSAVALHTHRTLLYMPRSKPCEQCSTLQQAAPVHPVAQRTTGHVLLQWSMYSYTVRALVHNVAANDVFSALQDWSTLVQDVVRKYKHLSWSRPQAVLWPRLAI